MAGIAADVQDGRACEVHLATNFQNILYDHLPEALRAEIYAFLDRDYQHERKADQTNDQFYYKTRKRALGPFKQSIWNLPAEVQAKIEAAWEKQFKLLFERLNIQGSDEEVDKHIQPLNVYADAAAYFAGPKPDEDVSDLAD